MTGKRISVFEELKQVDALVDLQHEPQQVVERLPFTVRIVQNEEDLMKAVRVRHEAYAKHLPASASALSEPEEEDERPDTAVLLAESKLDGSALGSVRVQTNCDGPLPVERSLHLPPVLQNQTLADARRLAIVRGGEGGLVRTALFKALFQYWQHISVDWAVVAARPPLHRTYERLMFSNVLTDPEFTPQLPGISVSCQESAFPITSLHSGHLTTLWLSRLLLRNNAGL